MAIRLARRVRPLIVVAAVGACAAITPTLASADPGSGSDPHTIASVQKQLGHLAMRNTQLVEKFNRSRITVAKREKAASRAEAAASHARSAYRAASVAFTEMIQAQYEAGSMSATGALLDSHSGDNYLNRLTTLDLMSSHNADVVRLVHQARTVALAKQHHAEVLLAGAKKDRAALVAKRTNVRHQITHYKKLLGILTARQRARYEAAQNPAVTHVPAQKMLPPANTSAARKAVAFALAQVGKPYVWGAAGPDSYDCSGLTMQSWAAAGVALPHSAADQYNYGTHVPESDLQPGDLIFFYQPIGHVTIYIGNGLMVSAPTEGEPVSVVPLSEFQSDYVGATRLT